MATSSRSPGVPSPVSHTMSAAITMSNSTPAIANRSCFQRRLVSSTSTGVVSYPILSAIRSVNIPMLSPDVVSSTWST